MLQEDSWSSLSLRPDHRCAIKEEPIVLKIPDWVYNQACTPSYNIYATSHLFIMFGDLFELTRIKAFNSIYKLNRHTICLVA